MLGLAIVILSEAKDLLAHPSKQILRFAQNDKFTAADPSPPFREDALKGQVGQ